MNSGAARANPQIRRHHGSRHWHPVCKFGEINGTPTCNIFFVSWSTLDFLREAQPSNSIVVMRHVSSHDRACIKLALYNIVQLVPKRNYLHGYYRILDDVPSSYVVLYCLCATLASYWTKIQRERQMPIPGMPSNADIFGW